MFFILKFNGGIKWKLTKIYTFFIGYWSDKNKNK